MVRGTDHGVSACAFAQCIHSIHPCELGALLGALCIPTKQYFSRYFMCMFVKEASLIRIAACGTSNESSGDRPATPSFHVSLQRRLAFPKGQSA